MKVKRVAGILVLVLIILGAYPVYRGYGLYRLMTVGTSVQARRLCSGLFVSHRDAEAILREDLAPHLNDPMKPEIDHDERSVSSTISGLARRKAIFREGLGCTVILGTTEKKVRSQKSGHLEPLPRDPANLRWPTGDLDAVDPNPDGVDVQGLTRVIEESFSEPDPDRPRRTRAVVVVYRGRIIAEQYAPGITGDTALIGWSMTKSVTSALIGVLVGRGQLSLEARAPIEEWDSAGDPRRDITLNHLLQMSDGLDFREDYYEDTGDILELFYRHADMASYAIQRPLKTLPGEEFNYSSATTNILSKIIQRTLGEEENFVFPRRALFNRIGMRSAVIAPDSTGNLVGASYMYATARDWARFGLLYLQDGTWEGERVLPEGWVDYTRTPAKVAPRWGGGYGAQFWLNSPGDQDPEKLRWPGVPKDAYFCSGHEGQSVVIIPSRDLVVVRLGMTHVELGARWNLAEFLVGLLQTMEPGRV